MWGSKIKQKTKKKNVTCTIFSHILIVNTWGVDLVGIIYIIVMFLLAYLGGWYIYIGVTLLFIWRIMFM